MVLPAFIKRFSSFTYLNITQFLGALNDNLYKLLIVFFFIQIDGIENSHTILAITGALFVLPFLLFSSSSGILADRFSKRNIIVITKVVEIVAMTLGLIAFIYESKAGSYFVLFLMATQSALFSPSKYGIIPEIVPTETISRANGLMTSMTFLAIIIGTFTASFLLEMTHRNFILAASICIVIAIIGTITSLCIEHTLPSGSSKTLNAHFLTDIYKTLKTVRTEPSLIAAVFGSAFFLFVAAFIQLNMIPFAVQSLHLTDTQGGYLFLVTAFGIGLGSVIAGKISGKTAELGLVPLACIAITINLYLVDLFSDTLATTIPLILLAGIFGGLYQVPLDAYIQIASPQKYRGQVLAANTFLSFIGVLFASALLYVTGEIFQLKANHGFTLVGFVALFASSLLFFQFFDYVTRLIGTVLSRFHFKATFSGIENIPRAPSIYVCSHSAWNDTLLLLGAQRRRMRFFIENEQEHSPWLKRLYRLLRVVFIPEIEPLENNILYLEAIKKTLDKGISVCLFVTDPDIHHALEKLHGSSLFRQILEKTDYPVIPVIIQKQEKQAPSTGSFRYLKRFRVPAIVSFGSACLNKPPFRYFAEDAHPDHDLILAGILTSD